MDLQDPLGMHQAMAATLRHVRSAQPGAPVVPDRRQPHTGVRGDTARRTVARLLRRVADQIEPRRQAACRPT